MDYRTIIESDVVTVRVELELIQLSWHLVWVTDVTDVSYTEKQILMISE